MTSLIVIRRNKFGRTPTRGKSNARPLSSGMEISNITRHAGRWTPILRDLSGISFARVRGVVAGMQHPGHCTSFLFSGLPRFQACKQSSRGLSQSLKPLLSRVLHAVIKAWSREHEVQRKSASGAQSVE